MLRLRSRATRGTRFALGVVAPLLLGIAGALAQTLNETERLRLQVEQLSRDGKHAEALATQRSLVAKVEQAEQAEAGRPGQKTAEVLGHLAWYALLARSNNEALVASQRAITLAPERLWIETNRAHALLLTGRPAEASKLYLAHRRKRVFDQSDKLWEDVIAEDFDALRAAGIQHPEFVKVISALGARPVAAKEIKIGNVTVNLPPPIGFCELERPSDARMINIVEGSLAASRNRLLGMSASCAELAGWRAGKRPFLDNIVLFQTLKEMEAAAPLPMRTEELVGMVCHQMRSPGEPYVFDIDSRAKARAEEISKQIRINETKSMGVLAQDHLACYTVLLQKFLADNGTEKIQVDLCATTFLKGKLVYFYLAAPFRSGATLEEMLARHKVNVERLHAANPK
jgi:hypothetical protein